MYSTLNHYVCDETITALIKELRPLLLRYVLCIDSRVVNENSIFCALIGNNTDGRRFINDALRKGAQYILYEPTSQSPSELINEVVPISNSLAVNHLAEYIGILAASKYHYPSCTKDDLEDAASNQLAVIGITGTNGKTSISYWLNEAYTTLGVSSATIGTTGVFRHINQTGIAYDKTSLNNTTPDAITLQSLLATLKAQQVNMVALEVSSHALAQGRVNGVCFKRAIFTNLSQDHLDYHHTMAEYFATKRQLFYWRGLRQVIINIDDPYGKILYHELKAHPSNCATLVTYAVIDSSVVAKQLRLINIPTEAFLDDATYRNFMQLPVTPTISASNIQYDRLSGTTSFIISHTTANWQITVALKVVGVFNVYNALAVVASLWLDGYSPADIQRAIMSIMPVVGRLQEVQTPQSLTPLPPSPSSLQSPKALLAHLNSPQVFIDYAHTPDALENLLITLNALKLHSQSKLICVFGCGGDRDKEKRPIMGKIATTLADLTIVTTDNPRTEDQAAIIGDIVSHIQHEVNNNKLRIVLERKEATRLALMMAKSDDIVVIAGKGHEDYQEINGKKEYYSDYAVAKECLEEITKQNIKQNTQS